LVLETVSCLLTLTQHPSINSSIFHHQSSNQNNFILPVAHVDVAHVALVIELVAHVACGALPEPLAQVYHCPINPCELGFQYFIIYKALIYHLG
jgi:hypothetical protein